MEKYIHYKNEETGYEGYLYGKSSFVIKNDKIGYYLHTGSRSINTFEELKEQVDELKAAILEEMKSKGLVKIETDELAISYVDSFDKEKFDNKKLKEDYPNLYDQYVSMSTVKPSIRIKVK